MKMRLLTDKEVKEVGNQLWVADEDMKRRLKEVYEAHQDDVPSNEERAAVVAQSIRLIALIETSTGAAVLREPAKNGGPTCECHRELTNDEAGRIYKVMDEYSDRISHLFDGHGFDYFEQLGRELCRVTVDSGLAYFGQPSDMPDNIHVVHLEKDHSHN